MFIDDDGNFNIEYPTVWEKVIESPIQKNEPEENALFLTFKDSSYKLPETKDMFSYINESINNGIYASFEEFYNKLHKGELVYNEKDFSDMGVNNNTFCIDNIEFDVTNYDGDSILYDEKGEKIENFDELKDNISWFFYDSSIEPVMKNNVWGKEWKCNYELYNDIDPEDFADILKNNDIYLVDSSTKEPSSRIVSLNDDDAPVLLSKEDNHEYQSGVDYIKALGEAEPSKFLNLASKDFYQNTYYVYDNYDGVSNNVPVLLANLSFSEENLNKDLSLVDSSNNSRNYEVEVQISYNHAPEIQYANLGSDIVYADELMTHVSRNIEVTDQDGNLEHWEHYLYKVDTVDMYYQPEEEEPEEKEPLFEPSEGYYNEYKIYHNALDSESDIVYSKNLLSNNISEIQIKNDDKSIGNNILAYDIYHHIDGTLPSAGHYLLEVVACDTYMSCSVYQKNIYVTERGPVNFNIIEIPKPDSGGGFSGGGGAKIKKCPTPGHCINEMMERSNAWTPGDDDLHSANIETLGDLQSEWPQYSNYEYNSDGYYRDKVTGEKLYEPTPNSTKTLGVAGKK